MVEFETKLIERDVTGKVSSEVIVENHLCSKAELEALDPPHKNQENIFNKWKKAGNLRCLDTSNLNTTIYGARLSSNARRYFRFDYRPCTPVMLDNNETGVCNVTNASEL